MTTKTFDWRNAPSATGQRTAKPDHVEQSPAERTRLALREYAIGGLPADELKRRIAASGAA